MAPVRSDGPCAVECKLAESHGTVLADIKVLKENKVEVWTAIDKLRDVIEKSMRGQMPKWGTVAISILMGTTGYFARAYLSEGGTLQRVAVVQQTVLQRLDAQDIQRDKMLARLEKNGEAIEALKALLAAKHQ